MPVTIPANDRKASNLYFLSSFLGLISSFIDPKPVLEAGSQAIVMTVLTLLLMAALMLCIGLGIREGYWLAKFIFLLLFAVSPSRLPGQLADTLPHETTVTPAAAEPAAAGGGL